MEHHGLELEAKMAAISAEVTADAQHKRQTSKDTVCPHCAKSHHAGCIQGMIQDGVICPNTRQQLQT